MSFRISARTILQLGAELISSDSIAFYELVKNAVDATANQSSKNKDIVVDIVERISHGFCNEAGKKLREFAGLDIEGDDSEYADDRDDEDADTFIADTKAQIESRLIADSYLISELREDLSNAESIQDLINIVEDANFIQIVDKGEGMSLQDLNNIYLTVGTNFRYRQKKQGADVLGEKGIGRLSTMRLGEKLHIKTSKSGERNWNLLEIDWRDFSHDSDQMLEDIEVAPKLGKIKRDPNVSGTTIRISALTSYWDAEKVEELVQSQFSRFTDPFRDTQEEIEKYFKHKLRPLASKESPLKLKIYYNNDPVPIHPFEKDILKYAHAAVWAELKTDYSSPSGKYIGRALIGEIYYRYRDERKSFTLYGPELLNQTRLEKVHLKDALTSLGPFKMVAFWFNRGLLLEAEGVPDATNIKKIVKRWGGGLMLFRNSFRIFPYGDPHTDDWLNVDEKGLASQGFKVNRRQLIGKVDITSKRNPALIDQTNRQGLRDNDEKLVLIQLLKHVLDGELRPYLTGIDKILRYKDLDLKAFDSQIKKEIESIKIKTNDLLAHVPNEDYVISFVNTLNESIVKIQKTFSETKGLAESYEEGKEISIHLAGVGLMVEFISHELHRATDNAIRKIRAFPRDVKAQFTSLEDQLVTIQKRLSVLDPTSISGRQRKVSFDLVEWVNYVFETHKAQFERHNILYKIRTVPSGRPWSVKAVKGMLVQVFENLISNSVYWFKQLDKVQQPTSKRAMDQLFFQPKIDVTIDVDSQFVKYTDNGIGILPERREDIFLPYVTTKPPNEGKGLGLFIAREIASYHDARIYLSEEHSVHPERLNTFVFEFIEGDSA